MQGDIAERASKLPPIALCELERRLRSFEVADGTEERLLKVARTPNMRLSFAQERLWFLDQLKPGDSAYNLAVPVALPGVLDLERLQVSLEALVHRHEPLRTTFEVEDGVPVQRIASTSSLRLKVIDAPAGGLVSAMASVALSPFDLKREAAFRASLLRSPGQDPVLLLTMHHIISDGWSLDVLARDLQALYRGESLPDLRIQYADYAVWQRCRLQGSRIDDDLDHWRAHLQGAPPLIDLPTDRPRSALRGGLGGMIPLRVDASLCSGLEALAQAEGATLFMILLAGFQALLHRISGQERVVVGAPIANRPHRDLEPLVGLFVNSLPLCGDLSDNPTFREFLARTRDAAISAYAHQELPFERLVEDLRPERSLAYSPVFQVMFVWQNQPGGRAREAEQGATAAKFDLTLGLAAAEDGTLLGGLEYACDLFDEPTVADLRSQFLILLEAVAAEPDRRLADVPLLTPLERAAILAPPEDAPAFVPDTLPGRLSRQALLTPDAIAVDAGDGTTLSYAELERRTHRLARHLADLGVGPDVCVGLCLERSVDFVVALRAVLQAGGAYLPLDPTYPVERLRYMLEDSGARVLVTRSEPAERLSAAGLRTVLLDQNAGAIARRSAQPFRCPARPGDLAYVIYTSGSAGRPKGVMIPHLAIINHMDWMAQTWPLAADDAVLQRTSPSFDASVWELLAPMLQGARLVLASSEGQRDPRALVEEIRERQVTVLQLVPSLLQAVLADRRSRACPTLRRVFCGGEALSAELCRRARSAFGFDLVNLYGPTEATIDATWWICAAEADDRPPPIGRPISNVRAHVLDGRLEPCPIGVAGELYIGGFGLARGYLGKPALTAERFVPDPFGPPGARMYRTGDRARRRRDRALDYLGRTDQQVKLRGFRIETAEVECALAAHEDIATAAVEIRDDPPGGQRLVAYVVARPGAASPSAQDLRAFLLRHLPDFMVPQALVWLEALPLTPNGKVDRRALPAPPRGPAGNEGTPATELERRLVDLWREVLNSEDVGVRDDFFASGGHSLLATQLLSRIQDRLGLDLSLRTLFEFPTAAALAEHLSSSEICPSDAPIPRRPAALSRQARLSFAQERLWFLDQLDPGNPRYNIPSVHPLAGPVDPARLERALSALAVRHEALRTTFDVVDGVATQMIAPAALVRLTIADVQEEAWAEFATAEASTPFDLRRGPLLRATLARCGDRWSALLLTMHHIVSDGWSMGVLFEDLWALYRGEALPPLAIQYPDFAAWQRDQLSGPRLKDLLRHWRETLADAPAAISLPTDRPRPPAQRFRGEAVRVRLPPALKAELESLAQREKATLFMVLLAGFQALLQRYSGQDVVLVGTPIANRTRREVEPLIGFFVNTLVLRGDFADDPSVAELLRRTRERALDAYAHQDLPFEKLVEDLRPQRTLSHHPLFQVMFVWQNVPGAPLDEGATYRTTTAKFDLTLALGEDRGGGIVGSIEFDADIFDRDTVERFAGHFAAWFASAAADPDRRVSALGLMGESERHEVLERWNDTAATYEDGSLHELIARQATRSPAAIALEDATCRLTYAELQSRSAALARRLAALGVGPGSRVGLFLERSIDAFVAILAVLEAGGAYVPLDPSYPVERLAYMLADAAVALVLTRRSELEALPSQGARVVCLDDEATLPGRSPERARPDDLAYIIYTSGSTGRPKGVMVPHRGLCSMVASQRRAFGLGPGRRVLQFSSLSFDISVWDLTMALGCGATLCIGRPEQLVPGDPLQTFLREQRIDTVTLLPSVLDTLDPDALPAVELVVSGAEACSAAAARRWHRKGRRFFNGYGPTETTVWATAALETGERRPPIGWPIGETRTYVLEPNGAPTPIGVPGELYISGVGVARGYHRRPDLTAEKFLPDPFGPPGARMYRTGDRVRPLADGALDFLGRVDEQVKVRGYRMEPAEIEAALREVPGVGEAVVVARALGETNLSLVTYLVGTKPDRDIRQDLRAKLPAYMIPSHVVWLAAIPRMPNGKVDRAALPEPCGEHAASDGDDDAVGTVAKILRICRGLLGIDGLGAGDDFFASGGHSLLATQLVSRIRAELGVELPVRTVFEAPLLSDLAARVDAAQGGESRRRIDRRPPKFNAQAPMSFAQERLWFLDLLEPASPAYNIAAALRPGGKLDESRLRTAVAALAARHEILRTTFDEVGGEPRQIIAAEPPECFRRIDLTPAELAPLMSLEAVEPFDLRWGPLLRVTLARVAGADDAVLVAMHHIIADGWSFEVFERELMALYRSEPLTELAIQYADFAFWQRGELQGAELDRLEDYWRTELDGAPPVLDLPLDRSRPATQTFRGGLVGVTLAAELAAKLEAMARREGATLFMVLAAGVEALLHRWSGQETVLLGAPVANRTQQELEPLIGLFVNTLVLRGDFADDPTGAALVQRTKERLIGAYAHQTLPFEKVVRAAQPERGLGQNPLVQVMFGWRSTLGDAPPEITVTTAKFDLAIELGPSRDGGLAGAITYAADLFEQATVKRLADHLRNLLEDMVDHPERRVSETRLITEAEHREATKRWNRSAAPFEALCVTDLLARQALRTPQATFVEQFDRHASYAEVDARATQWARLLVRRGVGPETRVGLYVDRSIDMIVAVLAVMRAGGAYVPLDPTYPADRIAFMIGDAHLSCVLTQSWLRAALPLDDATVLCLDGDAAAAETLEPLPARAAADDLAYVIYTSGSTGRPKGVMVTHRGLCNMIARQRQTFALGPHDRVLQFSSLSFDISIWDILLAMGAGATLCLCEREVPVPGEDLQAFLEGQRVTVATLLPSVLASLDPGRLPRIHTVISGAEACSAEIAAQWARDGRRFFNGYGPTETTVWATVARENGRRRPPIGWPIGEMRTYVLDARGEPMPIGLAGELYIAGAGLARGYLFRPDLTAERFIPDPFGTPGARMYRTGDRVRRLADGALDFLGRMDEQVKVRGFRIEPAEIEAALRACRGVGDAVVTAYGHGAEARLVAYVTGEPAPDLRLQLASTLPAFMLPGTFVALAKIPRLPNGKVDRRELPKPQVAEQVSAGAAPSSDVEARLAEIWRTLLGLDSIGVHDDFFALGGHSLLATRLVSRIRNEFGVDLPLKLVFEGPTIAGLAASLEGVPGPLARPEQIVPRREAHLLRRAPMSFAQERLWFLDRLEPGRATYNICTVADLGGPVDPARLQAATTALVRRHEALRTTFCADADGPLQIISPEAAVRIRIVDTATATVDQVMAEAAAEPFDLAAGPLLRVTLVRLADRARAVVLITVHHIVADGWSMELLLQELQSLYRGQVLAALPLQYADFAVWQRAELNEDRLAALEAHWREELAGAPCVLDIPTDRPRPAAQRFKGGTTPIRVDPGLAAELERLAQQNGATLFMLALTAFQLLLHRYSGQETVAVGVPVANRRRAELEGLVGFFANTLLIRGDFGDDPTVGELIARTRERVVRAYDHQDMPFEKLVAALAPERSLDRNPLFQAMIVWQNTTGGQPETSSGPASSGTAKFDLLLALQPAADGSIVGGLEYDADIFDGDSVERMTAHFLQALRGLLGPPDLHVSDVELIDAAERASILSGASTAPPKLTLRPLATLLACQAALTPVAPAIEFGAEVVCYATLANHSRRIAAALQQEGVGSGARVGICLRRSIGMVAAVLGVIEAGAAYVPLDPEYPPDRLAFMMEAAGVAAVIVDRGSEVCLPPAATPKLLVEAMLLSAVFPEEPRILPAGTAPGYVIFTSGSTGQPKGVEMAAPALENLIAWQCAQPAGRGPMRTLQFASLSFDVSFQEIFSTLASGGTLVLMTEEQRRDPSWLWDIIVSARVERIFLPFVALQQVAEAAERRPAASALRHIITAGEQLQVTPRVVKLLELTGAALCNQYGPTETHVVTQWTAAGDPARAPSRPPIGRPIANVTTYVLDRQMRLAPTGVRGELYVGGVALAQGYVDRPDLTAERFVPDPWGDGLLYRTGDEVRLRHDGDLQLVGRMDGQVKVRGFRIEPEEIESVLARSAGVAEAAVVAKETPGGDRRLVAYVVPSSDPAPDAESLLAAAGKSLPSYMIPSAVVFLSALPLTPSGKLDRRALPEPGRRLGASRPLQLEPRSALERQIAAIWCELLGLETVGVRESFFSVGGHSLLAAQLAARLDDDLMAKVSLRRIFEAPTIEGIAVSVVQARLQYVEADVAERLLAEAEQLEMAEGSLEEVVA